MANLYKAAKEGSIYKARKYVNAKEDINYKDEENGWTALIWASISGHKDIAKLLTDKGADLNLQDNDGRTALMKASINGYKDIAKLLTDKGADLNLQHNGGRTALMMTSNKDIAKLLIDKGADLNIQDNQYGRTALMLRVDTNTWACNKDIVKLLMDNGADLNIQDKDGQTALILASMNDIKDIAKLLMDKGADLNIYDKYFKTALDIAKEGGHTDIVELLEHGTSPPPPPSWCDRLLGVAPKLCDYCLHEVEELPETLEAAGKQAIDNKKKGLFK